MRPCVSCLKCGWIHFEASLVEAEQWVRAANDRRKETGESREFSLEDYKRCFRCGGSHENFDVIDDDDIPLGLTLQPILMRSERA